MVSEEIIQAEKKHLINVLGKKLIDSEERDDRKLVIINGKHLRGYNALARKYWPEEFERADKEHYRIEVHHIDFDRSNNRLNNLVVLTTKEHVNIHLLFDPKSEEKRKKISEVNTGSKRTEEQRKNISESHKNIKFSEEHKKNISIAKKNVHRVYHLDGTYHYERNEEQ